MSQLQVKVPPVGRERLRAEEIIKRRKMERKAERQQLQKEIMAIAKHAKKG
jgi:hypothetical protein